MTKMIKMSLIAAVAVTGMTSTVCAQPLEGPLDRNLIFLALLPRREGFLWVMMLLCKCVETAAWIARERVEGSQDFLMKRSIYAYTTTSFKMTHSY